MRTRFRITVDAVRDLLIWAVFSGAARVGR
jgi:hypothetical protein